MILYHLAHIVQKLGSEAVQIIKSSLYSRDYAEACSKWRSSLSRPDACATQLRQKISAVASRWRYWVRFNRHENQTQGAPRQERCLLTTTQREAVKCHIILTHSTNWNSREIDCADSMPNTTSSNASRRLNQQIVL